ncbi:MAG: hypothetical protein GY769_22595 [bacterium]|nr:hypothetical protein [bacterium]
MAVFLLFLLATAAGCISTLFWIPEDDLGRGYFQMNALIVLGLLGLAMSVALLKPPGAFGAHPSAAGIFLTVALVGAFLYYAAIWRERWSWGRAAAVMALVGAGGALLIGGTELIHRTTPLPHRAVLLAVALALSALILGWSLVTMLLGHWYLVAPRLTFRHLVGFCWVLLVIVLLRFGAVGSSLLAASSIDPMANPHPIRLLTGFAAQGMFFWFRIFWGLAIPLILAVMSLHCARNQSNQSATGILYVLVVGTFIGEITALFLTLTVGVPI